MIAKWGLEGRGYWKELTPGSELGPPGRCRVTEEDWSCSLPVLLLRNRCFRRGDLLPIFLPIYLDIQFRDALVSQRNPGVGYGLNVKCTSPLAQPGESSGLTVVPVTQDGAEGLAALSPVI